jgi:hypothetical protein
MTVTAAGGTTAGILIKDLHVFFVLISSATRKIFMK